MAEPLDVPELVRRRALANGAAGRSWLDDLPDVVDAIATRWGLRLGPSFHGGTASFVAAATSGSGLDCVLKVAMPVDLDEVEAFRRSVLAHQIAGGRGCAALLDHDDTVPAMLLERLGPNLDDLGLSTTRIMETIAHTLMSFWRPVADGTGLRSGPTQAAWLANYITTTWDELGRPCERRVIDRALSFCAERSNAFDPLTAVLVHGDAHGWNTLAAGKPGTSTDTRSFKFVDPEGLWSERAHDLSVPMREYNAPLMLGDTLRLVRARAELLAELCAVDPEPVLQWGFIERVSTGLANIHDFGNANGEPFLEVAARCL